MQDVQPPVLTKPKILGFDMVNRENVQEVAEINRQGKVSYGV